MAGFSHLSARRAEAGSASWPAALALLVVILAPLVAVLAFATADTGGLWAHLRATVLTAYIANSLLLVAGVVAATYCEANVARRVVGLIASCARSVSVAP